MTQFKSITIIDDYDHLPKWIGTEFFFEKHNSLRISIIEKLEENAKLKLQIAELQEKIEVVDKLWHEAKSERANQYVGFTKDIAALNDKLHRRNMLIKNKDRRIKSLENALQHANPHSVVLNG